MKIVDWKKYVIPPIAIYAAVFLFISALIGAKIDQHAAWVWIVTLAISIVGLYIATGYVKPKNWQEGAKYGVMWLVILFILDLILTLPFTGVGYFSDWRSYLPYVLTLAIPIVLAGRIRNPL